jgi:hypothetical protein
MKDFLAQLVQQLLQVDPVVAVAVVAIVSYCFGLIGRLSWTGLVWLYEWKRYGGWAVEVIGGTSGRRWHAPLDLDIIRHLKRRNYFAFKRDLGTIISGEGQFNFTFGVPVTDPIARMEPTAHGLVIDHDRRRITIDYTARHAGSSPPS